MGDGKEDGMDTTSTAAISCSKETFAFIVVSVALGVIG